MTDQPPSDQPHGGYTVEWYNDWLDYPEWSPCEQDDSDHPVTFATEDEAQAWIDARVEAEFTRQMDRWNAENERRAPLLALYERRKQVLIDAGLWKAEGESFSPLVGPGRRLDTPRSEPTRNTDGYRVAPLDCDCAPAQKAGQVDG